MASQLGLTAHGNAYYYLSKGVYVKNLLVLFSTLLTTSMSIDHLVYRDLYAQLANDMPEDILQYLLLSLGSANDEGVCRLDATKVGRAVALCVLHPNKVYGSHQCPSYFLLICALRYLIILYVCIYDPLTIPADVLDQ